MTQSDFKQVTLVMSSCIDPEVDGVSSVQRNRVADRLKDYLEALEFWLRYPDPRLRQIIYIDNSGYPLDELKALAVSLNPFNRATEFVSLNCNAIIDGLHYGYAEFVLLDRGLGQSELVQRADLLIKVTGRYRFPELSRLLDRLGADVEFAADSIDFYSIGFQNRQFVCFRSSRTNVGLFVARPSFYNQHVREIHTEMVPYDWKGSAFVENLLFQKIRPMHDGKCVLLRFPCNCQPIGMGGNNTNYSSLRHRLIGLVRAAARVVVPRFWF